MIGGHEQSKVSLEKEIEIIFKQVSNVVLKSRVIAKVKEVTKLHFKELMTEAMKRAILRDASMSTLESADLLAIIDKDSQKSRTNVGKYLIDANSFAKFQYKKKFDSNLDEGSQRNVSEQENQ